MKIWILSSDSQIESTQRLVQAFSRTRHRTEVLNPSDFSFEFGRGKCHLFHRTSLQKLPDLVLPRLGWQSLSYGLRLCQFFESAGVTVVNSTASLQVATDKLSSLQKFHGSGLPVPTTRHAALTLNSELHLVTKKNAHVFKTLQGSQGFGVTWTETKNQSRAQVDSFRTLQAEFLSQELVEESFGEDLRIFVAGSDVVASMKRKASSKELRSNLQQGGTAQKVSLTEEEKALAVSAARTLGLFYAGVDLMRTRKGPLLLEANPSPGLEGISRTCRIDVASRLVDALLSATAP